MTVTDPWLPWALSGLIGLAIGLLVSWSLRHFRRDDESAAAGPIRDDDTYRVLSVLRAAAVVVAADGEVLRASPPAYALGLVRHDELVQPAIADMLAEVRADGVVRESELHISRGVNSDGQSNPSDQVLLLVRVAPMGGGQLLVLADDRTEAQRLETIRRDFMVNVSHELKTPVGAISLLAETVGDAADDPKAVRKFAYQLKKEADRLAVLVREIIELSRLQAPGALAQAHPVPITDVVAEAIDRTQTAASAKNIVITAGFDHNQQTITPGGDRRAMDVAPGHLRQVGTGTETMSDRRAINSAQALVYGDASLLLTAVRNLLDNAVAYSPDNARVGVGIRAADGLVEIDVVDQGIGMSAQEQSRVFERFYRTDPARSRVTGGTGLGLSIVKHVAANHGGDVQVWSIPGQGSTFTLRLPALPQTAEKPAEAEALEVLV